MSIMFNQISINEEMLPIYIYIYAFYLLSHGWGNVLWDSCLPQYLVTVDQYYIRVMMYFLSGYLVVISNAD